MVVPTTARSVFVPVVSALLRSTDNAPSTTQNPCSTGNTWVTATARASPIPVRSALRTATDRPPRKPDVVDVTAVVEGISRSVAVVGGSRSPSALAHTGRASAAAAAAITRPVAPMVAAIVRRFNSARPIVTAAASSGAARIRSTSCR